MDFYVFSASVTVLTQTNPPPAAAPLLHIETKTRTRNSMRTSPRPYEMLGMQTIARHEVHVSRRGPIDIGKKIITRHEVCPRPSLLLCSPQEPRDNGRRVPPQRSQRQGGFAVAINYVVGIGIVGKKMDTPVIATKPSPSLFYLFLFISLLRSFSLFQSLPLSLPLSLSPSLCISISLRISLSPPPPFSLLLTLH